MKNRRWSVRHEPSHPMPVVILKEHKHFREEIVRLTYRQAVELGVGLLGGKWKGPKGLTLHFGMSVTIEADYSDEMLNIDFNSARDMALQLIAVGYPNKERA